MPTTSRRHLLAAIAASAASVPFSALTVAPARAAADSAATVQPFPAPNALAAGARSAVTLPPLDASYFAQLTLGTALTATVLPGTPARTEVTSGGKRVALLTHGARTVVLPGPERTFVENKRPFVDDFQRTLPDVSLPEDERAYWGTSPGGGSWATLGGGDTDYSVVPGVGRIALTTDGVSRHASLRDGEITDVDVRAVASFDKVPTGRRVRTR